MIFTNFRLNVFRTRVGRRAFASKTKLVRQNSRIYTIRSVGVSSKQNSDACQYRSTDVGTSND